MTPRRTLIVILAAASLAGFISYRHGYAESIAEDRDSASHSNIRIRERPASENDAGKPRRAKLTMAEKTQRLLFLADRLHSTDAITESWEIIRDLSDQEVRELLNKFEARKEYANGGFHIGMLYFRWAQLDPTAALESAGTHYHGSYADLPLESWMKHDPDAAIRWAGSSEKFKDSWVQADWIARSLSTLPPAEALAKAGSYSDKTRAATFKLISQNQADTPEGREAFLAGITRDDLPETERLAAISAFFKTWGAHDALAALDRVAGTPIKPEQQTELHQQILGTWGRNDPEAALTWMIGKPDALPDAKQLNYFRQWNQGAPQQAATWLARQSPEIQLKFKLTP